MDCHSAVGHARRLPVQVPIALLNTTQRTVDGFVYSNSRCGFDAVLSVLVC